MARWLLLIGALKLAALALLVRLGAKRMVIAGPSMAPALVEGDRVLVERLSWRRRPPAVGEIVVARVAEAATAPMIKRIAAGPGERVVLDADGVHTGAAAEARPVGMLTWRLGPDEYFLLGDNLDQSTDSRSFGVVMRRALRGRVWYRYWPPERRGRLSAESSIIAATTTAPGEARTPGRWPG